MSDTARRERLVELAERIGSTVAGPASADVDARARFPQETIDALREARMLSAIVPVELGGMGATIREMSDFCRILSHYCTSSALVLVMHAIEAWVLVHYGDTPTLRATLKRVVEEQLLIANATSEIPGPAGSGGIDDSSGAPRIDRPVLAASYAMHADLIATSVRRTPDAAHDDTVYLLLDAAQAEIEQTSGWDTLGLRGTCSGGIRIRAEVDPDAVYPMPWPDLLNNGHIVVRHLLASSAYLGLAESALSEAHAVVRSEARKTVGPPPSGIRLGELDLEVEKLRGLLSMALERSEQLQPYSFDDIAFFITLRGLKVASSAIATDVATRALQVCGIRGIFHDGPMRIERVIRDAHAALVMFGNDGFIRNNGESLVMMKSV